METTLGHSGHVGGGLLGIALLNTLGKTLTARPRPLTPDYLVESMSYPSAHTSTAVVLFGMTAAFIARELPTSQRFWAYWGAIAIIVPMALSRLVIGVHWLSDLIGGALLGLVVCALVQLAWQRQERPRLSPCPGGRWEPHPWRSARHGWPGWGQRKQRPGQPSANQIPTPSINVPAIRLSRRTLRLLPSRWRRVWPPVA